MTGRHALASPAPPLEAANLPNTISSSRISALLRFPLACVISFVLSSTLYSLAANVTGPELAAISRNLTDGWHIGAMVAWKVTELSIAWYAGYDFLDLAHLTLLNNVPHYFLLNFFYRINVVSALIPLAIDVIAIAIPFAILRQMNYARQSGPVKTPNQDLAQDATVQTLTAIFGASVYALVVYGSFATWLPTFLVVHFDGLRTLDRAHGSAVPALLATFIPLGYAATQFVFVPGIGSPGNPGITDPALKPEQVPFNTETATFRETLAWNLGLSQAGVTARARILAKRTAIMAACAFINTFVRAYFTVEGSDLLGAAGWAGVWALAAGLVGSGYSWLADE